MPRHSFLARTLWLLAIVALAVRVGDAHLHLCADGQEQRMSLHVADAPGQHHADEANAPHDDQDIEISAPTLFKKSVGADDDFPQALLVALLLILVLPVARRLLPAGDVDGLFFGAPFFLRPPLRGPPL